MGQKSHPFGLRLGYIKTWRTRWFAEGKQLIDFLHEDLKLRKYLKEKLGYAGISNIEIERSSGRVRVRIHTARPGVIIGRRGQEIDQVKEALSDLVKNVGDIIDGFSSINTIQAEVTDKKGHQTLPGEGRLQTGICGASIKWAGLDMVKKLKKLRDELGYSYTIIGVGGVTTAGDFFEYRNAGADVVMSATGAMWNPYLAKKIKERLARP